MPSQRPVFVVGCPRSGTTLLQTMLHAHPRIAVPPENRYVLEAYARRHTFGDLSVEAHRRELAAFVTARRGKFRDFHLDRTDVVEAITADATTLGTAFDIVMREFARANGRQRWCDKRPDYVHHTRILLRLFPDAQFVHLIRDGRACAASLKRVPWWSGGVPTAAVAWARAIDRGNRLRRRLPADTWFELGYERLVADPEHELRELCAFLDEDYDAAMLAPHAVAAAIVPARKTWHINTASEVSTSRVTGWRGELEPWEIGHVERVARRQLVSAGYELSGLGPAPSRRAVAVHLRRRLGRARDYAIPDLKDRWTARTERAPVATALPAEPS